MTQLQIVSLSDSEHHMHSQLRLNDSSVSA